MATMDENGTVLARQEGKIKPPPMYQVLLLNDDFTPMEFVVAVIQQYFNKDRETATQIMLKVHRDGKVCVVFIQKISPAQRLNR